VLEHGAAIERGIHEEVGCPNHPRSVRGQLRALYLVFSVRNQHVAAILLRHRLTSFDVWADLASGVVSQRRRPNMGLRFA
jgi:hypothetical protein